MPDRSTSPARRVVVLGLGGTIAMTATSGAGVSPTLSTAQLIEAIPGLHEVGAAVEVKDFRRVPGASLTFDDLTALHAEITATLADGVDGVVITQGTDTIEETAYLLDLAHTRPEPVIVTGAMRNPTLASADGPGNVLAAVQTAASRQARNLGTLVVFADEIHAAARVRKTHSTSGHTFISGNGGPLGYVVEGRPRILNHPAYRATVVATGIPRSVEVGLVTAVLGDVGMFLRAATDTCDGLVIAGFGAGHVPAAVVEILTHLAEAMPVVLASRTGAGSVLASTYDFPGSEADLLRRGLISAGFLDPLKARILLHQLLAYGHDRARIGAAFAQAGGYESSEQQVGHTPREANVRA